MNEDEFVELNYIMYPDKYIFSTSESTVMTCLVTVLLPHIKIKDKDKIRIKKDKDKKIRIKTLSRLSMVYFGK